MRFALDVETSPGEMPAVDCMLVRSAAGAGALIAGTMAMAWPAGLAIATRGDTLEPLPPLSCPRFLAAAVGVFALVVGADRS